MKQRCESCPTKADCVSAFGIFWKEKSGGGVGCEHPFRYRVLDGAARDDRKWAALRSPEKRRR